MGSGDFGFPGALATPWLNANEEPSQTPAGVPQSTWEEWMRWPGDSGQMQQPASPKSATGAHPSGLATSETESIAARRVRSSAHEMNIQLPGPPTTQPYIISPPTSMPFSFGGLSSVQQAFNFAPRISATRSPTSDSRPRGVSTDGLWSGRQSLDSEAALISPALGASQRQHPGSLDSAIGLERRRSSGSGSTADSSKSPQTSPEPRPGDITRKRKQSDEDDTMSPSQTKGPVKKTAHNMIEKRYRTNLNDKIAALRDSVPSLRVMSRQNEEEDDNEDLEGLAPAHKLNKATVLSKATEYIRHLEKRNRRQGDEIASLKSRVDHLEKLAMGPMMMSTSGSTSEAIHYQDEMFSRTPTTTAMSHAPQGMIPLPESIANLRRMQMQQTSYAPSHPPHPAYSNSPVPGNRSSQGGPQGMVRGGQSGQYMTRLMVGSLAALLLLDGFSKEEPSGEDPDARGLFSLPLGLLSGIGNAAVGPVHFGMASFKLVLIISSLLYVLAPLLDFKRRQKTKPALNIRLAPAPSPASPVEYRRKAWLTAIQTVWVPKHNFALELAALLLKTLKLGTRAVIGWHGYAILTGITKEQESARIKAWEVALDAQLTGGDAEISMGRLFLTFLASGTLPNTPARLMLKALHIRVIFWEAAKLGYSTGNMVDEFSAKLARHYWNRARSLHRLQGRRRTDAVDEASVLPKHLIALLELDSRDVLVDVIIQRAYNLAWNRPGSEAGFGDESMDSVVEDFAIASPLDAVAAWWSSFVTDRIIGHSMQALSPDTEAALSRDLALALRTAPPNSNTSVRALVAQALLSDSNREQNINAVLDAWPTPSAAGRASSRANSLSLPPTVLLNLVGETSVSNDVRIAITLAKCLALSESLYPANKARAAECVNCYLPTEHSYTLISFAAAFKVLQTLSADAVLVDQASLGLERIASTLRVWIGTAAGRNAGIERDTQVRIVQKCLSASKSLLGVVEHEDESDAGYASQSDDGMSSFEQKHSIQAGI